MARGRADGNRRKRLVITVLVLFIVGGLVYLYSRNSGSSSSIEYTSKSLNTGEDDSAVPKTIPVSYLNLNWNNFYILTSVVK
jgi:hypothetical protein